MAKQQLCTCSMLFCTILCRPVVARLQHESCQLHLLRNRFRLAKQQLCTCSMLFCTILCRPVVARLQHESCQLHLLSVKTRQPFPFSCSELIYRPLDSVYSRKNRQQLTKWIRWIKNDEFWSSANSLFKWRFRRRCCRGCVNVVDVYCLFFFLREVTWKRFC